jgi:hypothetical protein
MDKVFVKVRPQTSGLYLVLNYVLCDVIKSLVDLVEHWLFDKVTETVEDTITVATVSRAVI